MSELLQLAERCEQATGPDRELDVLIGETVGAADHSGPAYHRPFRDWAKHYTASIDAAMTLKPEDIDIDLSYCIILIDGKAWFAELSAGDPHQTGIWPKQGRGHNGALAICAAALRARAALSSNVREAAQ